MCILGWSKTPVSSQTDKLMAGTKFSDYLGLKHYEKAKKIKTFHSFKIGPAASKFKYIPWYITYSEFRPSTKKACFSDVMHSQISIFEIKMIVKISVIFMPFSNPTCHLRDIS